MRRVPIATIILALGLAASACTGARHPVGGSASQLAALAAPVSVPNLFDVQAQIDQYIASGRYDADVARVAQDAQAYLEQRAGAVSMPAIVLDIDETSLSNWPAYEVNGWARITNGECDLERGPCGLRAWQALGSAKALPPTLALVKRAKALGVAVFFISGRPADLQASTERNLREQGFEWDDVILYPPADASRRWSISKRRRASGSPNAATPSC